MKKLTKNRIVVTGVGPICSIGFGKKHLWKNVIEQKTNIQLVKEKFETDDPEEYFVHKVNNFNISKFGLEKNALNEIKKWKNGNEVIDLYYLIGAIKLALDDAGLNSPTVKNAGLVISNECLGFGQFYKNVIKENFKICKKDRKSYSEKEFLQRFYNVFKKEAYDLQSFMSLYHVAKLFQIHGYSLYLNNACSSGLYCIEAASQIIKSKKAKIVIVSASDQQDIFKYLWFKENSMYAKDGKIKPFAADCDGFVFGEGGAALVLEDYEHACKRGADIYAEYSGGGFALEGYKVTLPSISNQYYEKAIFEALEISGTKANEVDLICAHGVGTNISDQYEAKTLSKIFGDTKFKSPKVTAFKPYVGNNLGGCTLIESIILLLAINKEVIPPILNTKKVNPKINLDIVTKSLNKKIKIAVKTCCAFAGYDAAAVFKKIN